MIRTIAIVSLATLLATPFHAMAQDYIPIDDTRGLYCFDVPGGDPMVVRLVNDTVSNIDPVTEIVRLRKRIKRNNKRERTLKRLRKAQLPSENVKAYKVIYKYVFGKKFKGSREKALRKLNKLLRALRRDTAKLSDQLLAIEACERGELPDPSGGYLQVVEFPFTHPDFGVTYYMFGIGIVYSNVKKKGSNSVCVSLEDNYSTNWPEFPEETQRTPARNPCGSLYGYIFRNYPICSGSLINGDKNGGIIWVDDLAISTRPRTASQLAQLERKRDRMGAAFSRPYRKKAKCNN
jgi:hypothetical protein